MPGEKMDKSLTISKYYEDDHDRLDDLFQKFQKTKAIDFAAAKEYFVQFKFGLQRHIIWEEDILFPFFERKIGTSFGNPVHVMKLEHREIGRLLELIHNKVREGDPNSDSEEQELLSYLGRHNMKEENILYPAMDRAADGDDLDSIFKEMRDLPEEKYAVCCHHG
jgi:regulator of cell morphogenesis and NO signaling